MNVKYHYARKGPDGGLQPLEPGTTIGFSGCDPVKYIGPAEAEAGPVHLVRVPKRGQAILHDAFLHPRCVLEPLPESLRGQFSDDGETTVMVLRRKGRHE